MPTMHHSTGGAHTTVRHSTTQSWSHSSLFSCGVHHKKRKKKEPRAGQGYLTLGSVDPPATERTATLQLPWLGAGAEAARSSGGHLDGWHNEPCLAHCAICSADHHSYVDRASF